MTPPELRAEMLTHLDEMRARIESGEVECFVMIAALTNGTQPMRAVLPVADRMVLAGMLARAQHELW